MPHQSTIQVRFAELDPYAHVNHAVYLTYLEVARTEALAEVGLPLQKLSADGYQFVVTEIAVRYRRAAEADDTLIIETAVTGLGRASTRWTQRILRSAVNGGEPEVMVTGELKVGITNRSGRPTKPPAWLFEALQPLVQLQT
jgi:acyl-CoA thioester hydrolase